MTRLSRVFVWVRRYLPAEIAGTVSAVAVTGFGAATIPEQPLVIAFAASLAETVGFYAAFLIDRLWTERIEGSPLRRIVVVLTAALVEFGPAEVVDSLILRPLAMFAGMLMVGHPLIGVVVGKLAADVVFYLLAILSYESLVRRLLDRLRRRKVTSVPADTTTSSVPPPSP